MLFQCSSASRKFLNWKCWPTFLRLSSVSVLFSEPKIPQFCRAAAEENLRRNVSVLFSEPKIPQCGEPNILNLPRGEFQCSSASRKFLNDMLSNPAFTPAPVSVLFSEPKIPQSNARACSRLTPARVSVLFSEPKIPQSDQPDLRRQRCERFSALQRAENSSMLLLYPHRLDLTRFSALQRAENSSIQKRRTAYTRSIGFSALQRAENSSIGGLGGRGARRSRVSVLFSEPKIPQCRVAGDARARFQRVSVLFSEPKIPQ